VTVCDTDIVSISVMDMLRARHRVSPQRQPLGVVLDERHPSAG